MAASLYPLSPFYSDDRMDIDDCETLTSQQEDALLKDDDAIPRDNEGVPAEPKSTPKADKVFAEETYSTSKVEGDTREETQSKPKVDEGVPVETQANPKENELVASMDKLKIVPVGEDSPINNAGTQAKPAQDGSGVNGKCSSKKCKRLDTNKPKYISNKRTCKNFNRSVKKPVPLMSYVFPDNFFHIPLSKLFRAYDSYGNWQVVCFTCHCVGHYHYACPYRR